MTVRTLYLQAAVAAPPMWVLVRTLGLPRTTALIERVSRREPRAEEPQRVRQIAGIVNAAVTRVLGKDQCLVRSLVLQWMLARRGIASTLRLGVRRENGRMFAHAWVERAGEPVNDSAELVRDYAAFDTAGSER